MGKLLIVLGAALVVGGIMVALDEQRERERLLSQGGYGGNRLSDPYGISGYLNYGEGGGSGYRNRLN